MLNVFLILFMIIPVTLFGAEYKAEIITSWKVVETPVRHFAPDLGVYEISRYSLVTDQPGGPDQIKDPNLFVAYIEADNSTIEKMRTDGFKILWSKSKDSVTPASKETKASLDTLKVDLKALGITDAHLSATALANTASADVTASDVATQLKDVMAKFPAAKAVEEVGK
jgi:hypothetical protein